MVNRKWISLLASLWLLCASLLSVVPDSLLQQQHRIDTSDGVSLNESVIDDLRLGFTPDNPSRADLASLPTRWAGTSLLLLTGLTQRLPQGLGIAAHAPPFLSQPLRPPNRSPARPPRV